MRIPFFSASGLNPSSRTCGIATQISPNLVITILSSYPLNVPVDLHYFDRVQLEDGFVDSLSCPRLLLSELILI